MTEKYKLILGDCLEKLKELKDNSVDLIVTSPPYNVGIDYKISDNGYLDDYKDFKEYYNWCRIWLKELHRILKNDGRFCLNHYFSLGNKARKRHSPLMDLNYICVNEIGFKHHAVAMWEKYSLSKETAWGSWLSASAPYINSTFEGILILFKNQWEKENKGITTIPKDVFVNLCKGIWKMPSERRTDHPAPFHLRLPSNCLLLLSYEDDVVLDPFMGSGTTGVACIKYNRKFIGIEISKKYFKIAESRIKAEINQLNLFA